MKVWNCKKIGLVISLLVAGVWFIGSSAIASMKIPPLNPETEKAERVYNQADLTAGLSKKAKSALPSSYDGRKDANSYLPVVESQGSFSTCWSFSGTGIAEISMRKNGSDTSAKLSALHGAYFGYNQFSDELGLTKDTMESVLQTREELNYGGNKNTVLNIMKRGYSAPESVLPYSLTKTYVSGAALGISDDFRYNQNTSFVKEIGYVYTSSKDIIKQKILEHGAVGISYYVMVKEDGHLDDCYYNESTASCYQGEVQGTNHAVIAVGWDDNYDISNFCEENRPANPGAWLIRNSWGSKFGDGGYMWISYEDASISDKNREATFCNVTRKSDYDNIYQYDGGYKTDYIDATSCANVFTCKFVETLKAASIMTCERNVNYECKIYKNPASGNPTSGEQVGTTMTGTLVERGYHVIDFTEIGGEDISFSKGDTYSVVFTLKNSAGEDVEYPVESYRNNQNMIESVSAQAGESYYCVKQSWRDCKEYRAQNICVKAFTSMDNSIPCTGLQLNDVSDMIDVGEQYTLSYALQPSNATNGKVTWTSSNERIARVAGDGTVYAISGGTVTITGTVNGQSDSVVVTTREVKASSIDLPDTMQLYTHDYKQLQATLLPADTTDRVTYTSSDSNSIEVLNDNYLYVKKISTKPITITATTTSGEMDTMLVTTKERDPKLVALTELQSIHPYVPSSEIDWHYQRDGVKGYYVTFDELSYLEKGYDYLKIYNGDGSMQGKYTGDELSNKRIYISGGAFSFTLKTDTYTNEYGFKVAKIEEVKYEPVLSILTPSDKTKNDMYPTLDMGRSFYVQGTIEKEIPTGAAIEVTVTKAGAVIPSRVVSTGAICNTNMVTDFAISRLSKYGSVTSEQVINTGMPDLIWDGKNNDSFYQASRKCHFTENRYTALIVGGTKDDSGKTVGVEDGLGFVKNDGSEYTALSQGTYTVHVTLRDGDAVIGDTSKQIQIGTSQEKVMARFSPSNHMERVKTLSNENGWRVYLDAFPGYWSSDVFAEILPEWRAADQTEYMRGHTNFVIYNIKATSATYNTELAFLEKQNVIDDTSRLTNYYYEWGEPSIDNKDSAIKEMAAGDKLVLTRADVASASAVTTENEYNVDAPQVDDIDLKVSDGVTVATGDTISLFGVTAPIQIAEKDIIANKDSLDRVDNSYTLANKIQTLKYTISGEGVQTSYEKDVSLNRLMGGWKNFSELEFKHDIRIANAWYGKKLTVSVSGYDTYEKKVAGTDESFVLSVTKGMTPTPSPIQTPTPVPTGTPTMTSMPSNTPSVTSQPAQEKVKKIKLSIVSTKLAPGVKVKVGATLTPKKSTNQKLSYRVDKKKFASISKNGVLYTKKAGKGKKVVVTVKATDGSGVKAKLTVSIMKSAVKQIKISHKGTIAASKKLRMTAIVTPKNGVNKSLTWTVRPAKYASISKKGILNIKKKASGKTIQVTATSKDGSKMKEVKKYEVK